MVMFYVVHFCLWQLVFSYQRITLGIAKRITTQTGLATQQIQTALTPDWLGALGWINSGMSLAGVLGAYFSYGFFAAVVFVFLTYLGGYGLVSPVFDGLIRATTKGWTKYGLKSYEKSAAGYLTSLAIERALKEENLYENK